MTRNRGVRRLAVVASHPVQYFTPIYKRLAATPGLDLDVFFCRDFGVRAQYDKQFGRAIAWDTDQLGGYRHRFLTNISPVTSTFNPLHAINPSAFFHLLRGYDGLWLHGYLYPSNWFAAAAATLRGTSILYRSEFRIKPTRPAKRIDPIRERLIRGWVTRSDALMYIGQANREAYLAYGAREEQLFFSPYSVDVHAIERGLPKSPAERAALRAQWNVPADATVALFVGKLLPNKYPATMLDLAERLGPHCLHVVIAGSGPLEPALRADAERRGLRNVTFLGFVNQAALPSVYAMSDIFVMDSEWDTWGLVVNEAMAAGLPCIVAETVGASHDLIDDGKTGFLVRSQDFDAVLRATTLLADDPSLRARIGAAARQRASLYSHEATTQGIVDALDETMRRRGRR